MRARELEARRDQLAAQVVDPVELHALRRALRLELRRELGRLLLRRLQLVLEPQRRHLVLQPVGLRRRQPLRHLLDAHRRGAPLELVLLLDLHGERHHALRRGLGVGRHRLRNCAG